jgi:predicted transglutaminase-like cysteine proteinase
VRILLTAVAVALGAAFVMPAKAATPVRLFGMLEIRTDPTDGLPQWQRVLRAIATEEPRYRACAEDRTRCPDGRVAAWQDQLSLLRGRPAPEQIEGVNRFVNRWPYRTDAKLWARSDYWASPLEFFARSGDCEDYAIAKYVSLRQLGFAPERLRMVVLRDSVRGEAHAVLAVYLPSGVYILDNLFAEVMRQEDLSRYQPLYSLNEQARWVHMASDAIVISANGAGSRRP